MAKASEMRIPMAAGSHIRLSSITSSTGAAKTKPNMAKPCVSGWAAASPTLQEPNTMTKVATTTARTYPSGTRRKRKSSRPRLPISVGHRHGTQRQALARGEFLARALELPASGEDIAPARRAHRRGITGIENDLGESFDLLPVGAFVFGVGPWIERNEVDLRRNSREQLDQRLGLGERVVDVLEHHVFEGNAARVGQTGILAAGIEQLIDRIFAVERNELVAQLVAHGVERHRKHAADLGAGASDVRHDARGRERDPAFGDGDSLAVRRDQERVAHRLEIVERLAHAHHDDVGDETLAALTHPLTDSGRRNGNLASRTRRSQPIIEAIARDHDLPHDFAGRKVAHEALR